MVKISHRGDLMETIEKLSFAKINLALDVLYKRDDGYHELNTIMQEIDLADKLTFTNKDKGITIECNNKSLPKDSSNLVYKAWNAIRDYSGLDRGIHIDIQKNIPLAAGLAGGSANCATTLKVLNELWDLSLTQEELLEIGKKLGADVPFCIMGGTAKAQGIGEKLTKLNPFKDKLILIGNPGMEISSRYAYSRLKFSDKKIDIDSIISSMEDDDLKAVGEKIENIMENPIISENSIIASIKDKMVKNGALGALMSGSGPTVFGLFDDRDKILYAKKELEKDIKTVHICKTI